MSPSSAQLESIDFDDREYSAAAAAFPNKASIMRYFALLNWMTKCAFTASPSANRENSCWLLDLSLRCRRRASTYSSSKAARSLLLAAGCCGNWNSLLDMTDFGPKCHCGFTLDDNFPIISTSISEHGWNWLVAKNSKTSEEAERPLGSGRTCSLTSGMSNWLGQH